MRAKNYEQRPQRQKVRVGQVAYERGVHRVRRLLTPESGIIFTTIAGRLGTEVGDTARLFDILGFGVTIVGSSRFSKEHKLRGPSTKEVTESILSASSIITAKLGGLGIYGSGRKHKLGVHLVSDDIDAEVAAFERAFLDRGSPLKSNGYKPSGGINAHCSMALLFEDYLAYYQDKETLQKIGQRTLEGLTGVEVSLLPIPSNPHG